MAAAKRGARNPNARAVQVTEPDGTQLEFATATDAAEFFGVSQQLMDQWLKGNTAWPGTGRRVRRCNAWIASYSARFV
jgi:hypothetical protein